MRHFAHLWTAIQDLPRHLGQHSGGMVICAGRLDGVVPLEPAAMPGRSVVQWDKDDCAAMGMIKVDLLGLGMMALLEDALGMIRRRGGHVDLAHLPPDDPTVYAMLKQADTIGVFQVESRAQKASVVAADAAEEFYDLVVQGSQLCGRGQSRARWFLSLSGTAPRKGKSGGLLHPRLEKDFCTAHWAFLCFKSNC